LALDRIVDKCPMNERLAFY
jgi:hypothetical protein